MLIHHDPFRDISDGATGHFRSISMHLKTRGRCIAVLGLKVSYSERKPPHEIPIAHRKPSATIHHHHIAPTQFNLQIKILS